MKVALLQLSVGDDPKANLVQTLGMIRNAAKQGAEFVLTPEVTNCLSVSRSHQQGVLQLEEDDITLVALREEAAKLEVYLSIGSLGLKTSDPDGRFANRSFLIGKSGEIIATYDKIHMFDVDVNEKESFRESASYRPGSRAVVAKVGEVNVGMTVCYDIRFAHLHRALAKSGAEIILVPAAFSPVTGAAHWETLLRARAIETGCFVLAAAQTGTHPTSTGKTRSTYGHSLVVAPWGEVLADAGTEVGTTIVDIDLKEVAKARGRVASIDHDRPFDGP